MLGSAAGPLPAGPRARRLARALAVAGALVATGCGSGDAPGGAHDPSRTVPAAADATSGAPEASGAVAVWREGPRLPQPIANNAVAAMAGPDGVAVLSFLGVDSTKSWSGVTSAAYRWDFGSTESWRVLDPVPGPGRLAPTVQVVAGRVFLFGGYTVAEDGSERSVPDVDVYSPVADSWGRAADIPVPVDDAVSGVWGSSLVYLVSGWHDDRNVADVQIFDPTIDVWSTGTPIPGAPVFGHSGSIVGDEIVYVGGAKVVEGRPRFVVDTAAWRGTIDPAEPGRIDWEPLEHPPGPPLYRAASGSTRDVVLLAGGSDNPYNYDGVGYDGRPSSPAHQLLAYDPGRGWVELPPPPVATMDHRTLGVARGWVFLVGGMTEDQTVTDRVWYARVDELLAAGVTR